MERSDGPQRGGAPLRGGAPRGGASARDVQVTRHFSLTGETFPAFVTNSAAFRPFPEAVNEPASNARCWLSEPVTKEQSIGFCDWLSIYQRHPGSNLPRMSDGAVMRIDTNGEVESMTLKKCRIEGSHETAVFVRCDGETVHFDGNVSKWGRTDNVFGYRFLDCLRIVNALLQSLGLPPFSEGLKFETKNPRGEVKTCWTGAVITRVDITRNFSVGSKENAYWFMRYLQSQQASRLKTGTYGDGETVDFGRGSRRVYAKAYLKGPELRRHASRSLPEIDSLIKPEINPYILKLADWCDEIGLVRFEVTLKSTKLHSMGCNYLGSFDMKQIENEFESRSEILTRSSADVDELTDLPKPLLSTYRMWQAGDDVTSKMSRATFFRHRRELLPFGVDIAVKSNVVPFRPPTRVIKLGPVSMPDFYELPSPDRKIAVNF